MFFLFSAGNENYKLCGNIQYYEIIIVFYFGSRNYLYRLLLLVLYDAGRLAKNWFSSANLTYFLICKILYNKLGFQLLLFLFIEILW